MRTVIATTEPEQRILNGDVRECLRALPDGSVQCAVTSIPYWRLRSYGTDPQVWGGSIDCSHDWTAGRVIRKDRQHMQEFGESFSTGGGNKTSGESITVNTGDTCVRCGCWRGELGGEPTPELFVAHVAEVFREVRRVLRADGTLWLNCGDTYATGAGSARSPGGKVFGRQNELIYTGNYPQCQPNRMPIPGLKPKDQTLIPHQVAIALRADGWWLRDTIIWAKGVSYPEGAEEAMRDRVYRKARSLGVSHSTAKKIAKEARWYHGNPMPSSVEDRTTTSHEPVFLFTKSARYFYDADAIREAIVSTGGKSFGPQKKNGQHPTDDGGHAVLDGGSMVASRKLESADQRNHPLGRNRRSVWCIPTQSYHGAHFATYPVNLVLPIIQAGTSERGCCAACGKPWRRIVERTPMEKRQGPKSGNYGSRTTDGTSGTMVAPASAITIGWKPGCNCGSGTVPCVVLDPFAGSGTTLQVARHLGRRGIGCELNPDYVELAVARINEPIKLPKEKRKRRVQEMRQRNLFAE